MQNVIQENQYKIIFENNPQFLWVLDKTSFNILDVNDTAVGAIGFTREEFLEMNFLHLFSDDQFKIDKEAFLKEILPLDKNGIFSFNLKEGSKIDVEISLNEIDFENKSAWLVSGRDITEGKIKNKYINQLAAIIESSEDAIISEDLQGNIVSWNKAAEKLLGYKKNEVLGKAISLIIPPENIDEQNRLFTILKSKDGIERYDTIRIRKDGTKIFVSLTLSPLRDSYGNLTGASSIAHDITERKKLEEEHKDKEKQLIQAQKIAHLGNWERDLKTNQLIWSDELYEIYGFDPKKTKITHEKYIESIYPDDRAEVIATIEQALVNHRSFSLDYRIIVQNGCTKSIHGIGEVILDENFQPVKLRGIGQDVTEQKRAEKFLAVQFEVTRVLAETFNIIEAVPKIIQIICNYTDWQIGELWMADSSNSLLQLEGSWYKPNINAAEFIEVSKKCKFGLGVSLQGKVWENGIPILSVHALKDQFFPRAALASKLKLNTALAFPVSSKNIIMGVMTFYKDGVEESSNELLKMFDSLGKQIGDFIDRLQTVPELQESKGLYKTLVEISPDAIIYTDLSGKIIFCNQLAADLFGYKHVDEIVGQNVYAFISHKDQEHAIENENLTIQSGRTKNIEYTLIRNDGTPFPAEINTSIVSDSLGKPKAFISVIRDISKRKQDEEEIITRIRQQAAVAEFGQKTLEGKELDSILGIAADCVTKTLSLEFCEILEFNADMNLLSLTGGKGWHEGSIGSVTVSSGKESHAGFTLLSSSPVIVENFQTEERFHQSKLLIDHQVKSGITVVIQGKNNAFGVLGAHSKDLRSFSNNDANFLQAIANVLSTGIENSRLYAEKNLLNEKLEQRVKERTEELEISNRELEVEVKLRNRASDELKIRAQQQSAISWFGQIALTESSLKNILNYATEIIAKTLSIKYCEVFELNKKENFLLLKAGTGWKKGDIGNYKINAELKTQAGYTLLNRGPVLINDIKAETRFTIPDILIERKVISGMSTIIKEKEKVFGIICVHSIQKRKFSPDDINFLSAISNIIAASLERFNSDEIINVILESSSNAIIIYDIEQKIKLVNSKTEKMFGYMHDELLDTDINVLLPSLYEIVEFLDLNIEGGANSHIKQSRLEIKGKQKNGNQFPVEVNLKPIKGKKGILFYTEMRGISERN
jgi:PAS domain S-box-containing protein